MWFKIRWSQLRMSVRKGGILWSFRAGFVFSVHFCGHVVLRLNSGRRSRNLLSTGVCSRKAMGVELMIGRLKVMAGPVSCGALSGQ